MNGYPFSADVSVLGLAVGVWLLALATGVLRRHLPGEIVWRRAVYVLMSLAVYLHPTASSSALRLLDYRSVQLSATAVAALEDSSGTSAASSTTQGFSTSPELTTVSVVASNPLVRYFGILHAPAGGFAVAALVSFVALMPALTFLWLWQDAQQRRKLAQDYQPILFPFIGGSDYGPASWYWRHVDIVIVFGLSATNALLPTPASLLETAVRLAVTITLLVTLALLLVVRPNPYRQQWKRPVRLSLVALSAACAAINAGTRALDLGYGGPVLSASIVPVAYTILVLTGITLVTLIVGFGYGVLSKALEAERVCVASVAGAVPLPAPVEASPSSLVADDLATVAVPIDAPRVFSGVKSDRNELLGTVTCAGGRLEASEPCAAVVDRQTLEGEGEATLSRLREAHTGDHIGRTTSHVQRAEYPSGRRAFEVGQRRVAGLAAVVPRSDMSQPPLLETARHDVRGGRRSIGTAHSASSPDSQRPVHVESGLPVSADSGATLHTPNSHGSRSAPSNTVASAERSPAWTPPMPRWEGFVTDPFEDGSRARRGSSAATDAAPTLHHSTRGFGGRARSLADPLASEDIRTGPLADSAYSQADPHHHTRQSLAGARRLSMGDAAARSHSPLAPSAFYRQRSTRWSSGTLQALWERRQLQVVAEARRSDITGAAPVSALARRPLPDSPPQTLRPRLVDAGRGLLTRAATTAYGGESFAFELPPGAVAPIRRASESAGLARHPLASPATAQESAPSVPRVAELRRRSFLLTSALVSVQSPLEAPGPPMTGRWTGQPVGHPAPSASTVPVPGGPPGSTGRLARVSTMSSGSPASMLRPALLVTEAKGRNDAAAAAPASFKLGGRRG